MAKDRERSVNPAAAQRKAEKQKALKKGKAAVAAQRTERHAKRDPRHLETRISDLQLLKESQGGKLSARDQKQLEEAEKDVVRVKKARKTLGDRAPPSNDREGRGAPPRASGKTKGNGDYRGPGKNSRDEQTEISGSETDESVRRIPWPKDNPPPIPPRRHDRSRYSTNANTQPLGAERRLPPRQSETEQERLPDTSLPPKPVVKTTYESAPQVRDLKKEATAKFVPAAVRRKIDASKSKGSILLEEEDLERLEKEGYGSGAVRAMDGERHGHVPRKRLEIDAAPDIGSREVNGEEQRLEEEEERFTRELELVQRQEQSSEGPQPVQVEEMTDEEM